MKHTLSAAIVMVSILFVACTPSTPSSGGVVPGDKVTLDYVGTLQDGSIFDTTLADEAKKGNVFNEQKPYQPFTFIMEPGQVVEGFYENLLGMTVGQEKTFTIPPEKAYGATGELNEIPLDLLGDTVKTSVPRSAFAPNLEQEVPVAELQKVYSGAIAPGQEVTLGEQKVQILAVGTGSVKVSFPNTMNPFAGKDLTPGLSAVLPNGGKVTILSLSGETVNVEEDNVSNPFRGKKLESGLSGTLPDGSTLKIISVGTGSAQVEILRGMQGKALTFRVILRSIEKKPAAVSAEMQ